MRVIRAIPVIPGLLRSRFIKNNSAFILSFMLGSAITYFFCSSSKSLVTNIDETTGYGGQKLQKLNKKPWANDEGLSRERSEKVSEKTLDLHTTVKVTTIQPTTITTRKEERYPPLIVGDGKILTPADCNENYFIVFIVITSSRKFAARKSIRSSWVNKFASTVSENFKAVFVMGCDNENDKRVEREATKYRDIIRGNYKDGFRQNEYHSVKSLLGLKWASTNCQSKYVMLSYDETFVNVATTIKWIKSLENDPSSETSHRKGLFAGFCHGVTRGGARVVRNPKSQWYISKEEYNDDTLPPYASGAAIVLSKDVVATILDLSKMIRLIHIGDVYIGILARKMGITCSDFSSRFDTDYTTMLTECEELKFCAVGSVPAKDMFYLTQNIIHLQDICEKQQDEEKQVNVS